MEHISYRPKGVCSSMIDIDVEDGIVKALQFHGGCPGNTMGLSHLVVGMKAEDVVEKLAGIRCGYKATSCPDQLSLALREYLNKN